jgi:hypothetical protein
MRRAVFPGVTALFVEGFGGQAATRSASAQRIA